MEHNITSQSIRNLFFEFQSNLVFYERKFLKQYQINDITPNEAKILHLIGTIDNKSMSEIADKLKITYGTLSTTINSLVKKGYLIRTRDRFDRRVIVLHLTKKCIDILKKHEMFHFELINQLITKLSNEKVVILNEILTKLNQILKTNFCEGNKINENNKKTEKTN